MGDIAVRNNTPPAATHVDTTEPAVETKSAPTAQGSTPPATEHPAQKPEINKEHAAAKKGEHYIAGSVRQKELQQTLGAKKAHVSEFPASADLRALQKVGVHRVSSEDQTVTRFPNGVKMETFTSIVASKHPLKPGTYPGGIKQESGGAGFAIDAPPGGKATVHADGRITISDAKGKEVASMDKEGKLQVHTKYGEYTQKPDGALKFSTKDERMPGVLHKKGPISPGDYENYGIVSDGKTLQFPNGITYSPGGESVETSTGTQPVGERRHTVTIPREYKGFTEHGVRGQSVTSNATGQPLYDENKNHVTIYAPDGLFHISPGGDVEFHPN